MDGRGSIKMKDSLYLVTEESTPIELLEEIVEKAVKGGVTIVQLREKNSTGKVFYEKAKIVKELLDRYDVPLMINDRIDIALAVGASGVHIGQKDLPLPVVREMLPSTMKVGISVSTVEQAKEAEKNGADYIGVGAVYPTQSKKDARVLPEGMLLAITEAVNIPAVAIGGIKAENIHTLKDQGLAGVCVVSAIMGAKNPKEAAAALVEQWELNS